jgi:hypothetical protein
MQQLGKQQVSKQYTRWLSAVAATCAVLWLLHYKLGVMQLMADLQPAGAAAVDFYPESSGVASLQGADIVLVSYTNSGLLVRIRSISVAEYGVLPYLAVCHAWMHGWMHGCKLLLLSLTCCCCCCYRYHLQKWALNWAAICSSINAKHIVVAFDRDAAAALQLNGVLVHDASGAAAALPASTRFRETPALFRLMVSRNDLLPNLLSHWRTSKGKTGCIEAVPPTAVIHCICSCWLAAVT